MSYIDKIKFLVMDVDGTLTDGKVYMGNDRELIKAFDIKDGCAIKLLLPKCNITPVIITARKSEILNNRCQELGITELYQNIKDKRSALEEIIGRFSKEQGKNYSLENVAYIGDDIIDLECMQAVKKAGGLVAAPKDAVKEVLDIADFISVKAGGEGAVRELIDWFLKIKNANELSKIKEISPKALDFILNFCPWTENDGTYQLGGGTFANVMTYLTNDVSATYYESHQKYIDVQYIIYGNEEMLITDASQLKECVFKEYDEQKDIALYKYDAGRKIILDAGSAVVLYPNDAHRGAISNSETAKVRKIVVKVPV